MFEASRTLEPTDEKDGKFFGPSRITEKSKSDAKFVFFLAAHLLSGQAAIGRCTATAQSIREKIQS